MLVLLKFRKQGLYTRAKKTRVAANMDAGVVSPQGDLAEWLAAAQSCFAHAVVTVAKTKWFHPL